MTDKKEIYFRIKCASCRSVCEYEIYKVPKKYRCPYCKSKQLVITEVEVEEFHPMTVCGGWLI